MNTVQSVNALLPAFRAVIKACIERNYEEGPNGATLDAVLNERYPLGKGGVGHAHRKLQAEIRQQIDDFYAPRDCSPEPTYQREFA